MNFDDNDDDQVSEDNESKSYRSYKEESVSEHDDPENWAGAKAIERRYWERLKKDQEESTVKRTESTTFIAKGIKDFKDPLRM